ncbi:MAG: DUF1653 domain-containing protein [Clostridiales bacterium]|nr:DUF1653 domain-containing protein [Clostridiales bacterium]
MPSFKSKLLSGTIKSVKPLLSGIDISRQRKGMTMLGRLLPKPKDVKLEKADDDCPLPARWAIPEGRVPDKVILYTHGGSYVSGSPETHEPLICRLAERCRVAVFAYDYRLAPEHPYPAALQDAQAAYDYLLGAGYAAGNIVICGDSAGGGLTLALAMSLQERETPLPASIVLLSPWTDLSESLDSHYSRAADDPILSSEELRETALLYAGGEDLKNPYLSPLHGDFSGFPPVLIQVGTDEVLLDDSRELAVRMDAQGLDVDIDIYEGMWHVWHLYDVPESHQAMDKIKWFVCVTTHIDGLEKRVIHPGGIYRHFKGRRYRVLHVARHSETLEELVVYQQLYGEHGIWVRPLEMFLGTVERDGKMRYRFEEETEDPIE